MLRAGWIWYRAGVSTKTSVPSGASAGDDYVHSEEFLQALIVRQLRLSAVCALAFLAMLVGLPLANYFLPELMAQRVLGGFTLSWFLLGIAFFPAVWVIAWLFIRSSIRLEQNEVREARSRADARGGKASGERSVGR